MNLHGEIEFLGTGTSTGVPLIGCNCEVCSSTDSRDKRLRTSAIVRIADKNILLDCGPDFREQILRATDNRLDLALLTHIHYDHVGGIEDLRPYCYPNHFPIYAQQNVIDDLIARIPYCFVQNPYPGVPQLTLNVIDSEHSLEINGLKIEALPIWHYKLLINGYLFGKHLAYITDAKTIDKHVIDKIKDIDVLIINSLRPEQHLSHMTLDETLNAIKEINPKRAYLIHMGHDMGLHEEISKCLPHNVFLAYDGLIVNF